MRTFRLKADVTLEAESIDDVFYQIANYYMELYDHEEGDDVIPPIFSSGEITITPEV